METKIRVLHLEDNPADAELVKAALAAEGLPCEITHVLRREEFLRALEQQTFDIILSDHSLPAFDGYAAMEIVRARLPATPFLFVTGSLGEDRAVETFRRGATDYILKEQLDRLGPAVRRAHAAAQEKQARQAAESALAAERQLLRAVLDNVQAGILACDAQGRLILVNRGTQEFHGQSIETVPTEQIAQHYDLFHADGKTPLGPDEVPLLRALRGEVFKGMEIAIVPRHAPARVVLASGQPMQDPAGNKLGAVIAFHDVTELKQAAAELLRSRQQLEAAQQIAHLGSWEWDLESGRVVWSDELFRLLGLVPGQFVPSLEVFLKFVHPDDQALIRATTEAALRGEPTGVIEYRVVRLDGAVRILEARRQAVKDATGRVVRLTGALLDITERKQAETRIQEQALLLDEARDAICVSTLDCRIDYWNQGAEQLFGWTAAEVRGRHARELFGEAALPQLLAAKEATEQTGHWSGELPLHTKAGKEVIVQSRWTLLRDEAGQPKSLLIINTDITEKKQLEAQFLRAQRLETIGVLAGGIAHDLNNMLAPILMVSALLRTKVSDPDGLKWLDTLETSAKHGAELIKQILAFARGVEGERIELQVRHIILDVEKLLRETFPRSIRLQVRAPRDLWPVQGIATQLNQVLMNLCVNARDAMPNGGRLEITAENTVLHELYARQRGDARPGPHVLLTVSDSGTGIPPDVLPRIFEPFFSTKEVGKGTGLGLSTVANIVKGHEGFLHVYSELGKGTAFKVYLPALASEVTRRQDTEPEPLPRGKGECVLVVDDEAGVRQVAKASLESHGYRVFTASDGTEALTIFIQQRAQIDLVLTDMMMPFMDGPSLIRALRNLDPAVRIIGCSGLMDAQRLAQLSESGPLDLLQKPFDIARLLKTVAKAVGAPAGEPA
jgi:PAS domain S-box-containing protein